MEKIYSKVDPEKLLHIVVRKSDLQPGRSDVVPDETFYLVPCLILHIV